MTSIYPRDEAGATKKLADFRKYVAEARLTRNTYAQPNYTSLVWLATAQAICVGHERITGIEFGVAQGRGFLAMIKMCEEVTARFGIAFDIYGFDTTTGLPDIVDFRDHPEIWRQGDYKLVKRDELYASLPAHAQIIDGNVSDTVRSFLATTLKPSSPLAFVSVDLDLYSSTVPALEVLTGQVDQYLPAVVMYFDDIDGLLTLNKYAGEELAIEEFNQRYASRKIQRKVTGVPKSFVCHVLDHPLRHGKTRPLIPIIVPASIYS